MKPPSFDYIRATALSDALSALTAYGGSAKVLAGGQSLVPMMNFRLLAPSALIDISKITELNYITLDSSEELRIGSTTRHHQILESELIRARFPILAEAMRHVAHLAIRNRGTIGGSLCHADPAAELPMMAILHDARICLVGPDGVREVNARDFLVGALTTAISDYEIVKEIIFPSFDGGWGFREFSQRSGDFALAAAGALLKFDGKVATRVRIAVMGVGDSPARCPEAESVLKGCVVDEKSISIACDAIQASVRPETDLHASAAYRVHLIAGLARLALQDACRESTKDRYGKMHS